MDPFRRLSSISDQNLRGSLSATRAVSPGPVRESGQRLGVRLASRGGATDDREFEMISKPNSFDELKQKCAELFELDGDFAVYLLGKHGHLLRVREHQMDLLSNNDCIEVKQLDPENGLGASHESTHSLQSTRAGSGAPSPQLTQVGKVPGLFESSSMSVKPPPQRPLPNSHRASPVQRGPVTVFPVVDQQEDLSEVLDEPTGARLYRAARDGGSVEPLDADDILDRMEEDAPLPVKPGRARSMAGLPPLRSGPVLPTTDGKNARQEPTGRFAAVRPSRKVNKPMQLIEGWEDEPTPSQKDAPPGSPSLTPNKPAAQPTVKGRIAAGSGQAAQIQTTAGSSKVTSDAILIHVHLQDSALPPMSVLMNPDKDVGPGFFHKLFSHFTDVFPGVPKFWEEAMVDQELQFQIYRRMPRGGLEACFKRWPYDARKTPRELGWVNDGEVKVVPVANVRTQPDDE